ncbi:MAG: hypothetical protein WCJ58_02495 [bacterium]
MFYKIKNSLAQLIKQDWFKVLLIFLGTRLLILFLGVMAQYLFQTKDLWHPEFFSLKNTWQKWDVDAYEKIAINGYPTIQFVTGMATLWGFMPLYSWIVGFFLKFTGTVNFVPTAMLISNIFSYFGTLFLFKFAQKKTKYPYQVITFVLLAAGSFYLSIPYTESLFFLLTAMVFYYTEQKKYLIASIAVGLAMITRIQAVALLIIPIWPLFFGKIPWKTKIITLALSLFFSFLPLALFMFYGFKKTGDAFVHFDSQSGWDNPRPYPLKSILGLLRFPQYFPPFVHALLWAVYGLPLVKNFRKIPFEYLLFCAGIFLISSSTPIFTGTYRYVLCLIPLFIVLSKEKKWLQQLFLGFNLIFMVIFIVAFVNYQQLAI